MAMGNCAFGTCTRPPLRSGGLCVGHVAQTKRGQRLSPLRSYLEPNPIEFFPNHVEIVILSKEERRVLLDEEDLPIIRGYMWSVNSTVGGYARAFVRGSKPQTFVLMHTLLLRPKEGMSVDHINGNRIDNRKSNLRVVTPSQNQRNLHSTWASTGHLYVHDRKDGWYRVQVYGNYLGQYKALTAAIAVRDRFLKTYGV